MRKLRMLPLALAVALAAMAFAVPGLASATYWTNGSATLEEDATLDLSGSLEWQIGSTYLNCEVEAKAVLYPGDDGQLASFDTPSCYGGGGFEKCAYEGGSIDNAPWALTADSGAIPVEGAIEGSWRFDSECGYAEVVPFEIGDITLTPDSSAEIGSLDLDGDITIFGSATNSVTADLEVSPYGQYGYVEGQFPLAETALCEDESCAGIYPRGEWIIGESYKPVFETEAFGQELPVECQASVLAGPTMADGSYPKLPISVAYLAFGGCEMTAGASQFPCTLTAPGIPLDGALSDSGGGAAAVSIYEAQGGAPELRLSCDLGAAGEIDCTFGAAEEATAGLPDGILAANLQLAGGDPAFMGSSDASFDLAESTETCPAEEWSGELNAEYEVVSPSPLYVGTVE